jgi:CTP synthase
MKPSITPFLLLICSICTQAIPSIGSVAVTKPWLVSLRGGDDTTSSTTEQDETLDELVQELIDSNRKLVVVTGGVLSGIGKGVTASSVGVLFRAMGYRVTALKIDPYLNVDAGTMSPFEHGEVFVLDDGGETDLDLGNYERFLSVCLTKHSNLSTGKIYQSVIEKERVGKYLGKTVQIVPHISDAIQEWVLRVAKTPVTHVSTLHMSEEPHGKRPEICIVELGGTLGDIESMPFVEALRQLQEKVGWKNMCFVHVSLVPVLGSPVREQKTKPTQHSVKMMMQLGLRPDFLCCRGTEPLEPSVKRKLSLFTSVPDGAIISLHDVSNTYRVPLMMMEQNMPAMLAQRLRLPKYLQKGAAYDNVRDTCHLGRSSMIKEWTALADSVDSPENDCTIAMVGKYLDQGDAYLSVIKALTHAAIATKQKLKIEFLDASELETENGESSNTRERLLKCDGMVVPGGFGSRGFEGKIEAIRTARLEKIPFLGICLGMQAAVVEYARNVGGIAKAHSAEFVDPLSTDHEDVIMFMPEGDRSRMGGTMRLGARETILRKGSLAYDLYGRKERIMERHRHRYEVNPNWVETLESLGLHFVGRNTDSSGERMEVIEMDKESHPYFVGAQYHPEFTSRPENPNPLFLGLLQEIKRQKQGSSGGGAGL